MNTNWTETKAKIKTQWNRLSDTEIESFRDHLDRIPSQIEKTYGLVKEQAEKQFAEFKKSLESSKDSSGQRDSSSQRDSSGPRDATGSAQKDTMKSEGGKLPN